MIPGSYDFTIERGATEPVTIRLKTKDAGTGVKAPLDLTGATVALTIAPGPYASGSPITKSWIDGGAVSSGFSVDKTTGAVVWTPTSAESASLPQGKLSTYRYDVTLPGGLVRPWLRGWIIGL